MLQLSDQYWNNRYLTNDFGWDIGEISTPLKTYFESLTNKNLRILIPGAGNAYEAEWLIKNGFKNIYVCDYASEPLKNLKSRCYEFPVNQLLQVNFFELMNLSFDLIVEQTFFCAIDRTLRPTYFKKIEELLAPNGSLVGLLFNTNFANEDAQPPFGGHKQEYLTYIQETKLKIHKLEPCYNSIPPRSNRELFIHLIKLV
jgi:thiopurine S-methyltransferase